MTQRVRKKDDISTVDAVFVGSDQVYITASVQDRNITAYEAGLSVYRQIAGLLAEKQLSVTQERLFGSLDAADAVKKARSEVLRDTALPADVPLTYIEGRPLWEKGFAGAQITAFRFPDEDAVRTIKENGVPKGRSWKIDGATYIMLQDLHGRDTSRADRSIETARMFERAEKLLRAQGASYKNVVRTWIYLSDILDWYTDFNTVRNRAYREMGLLPGEGAKEPAEQIYLPASTGIEGDNPHEAAAVMDLLALIPREGTTLEVAQRSGVKQRSPFRYRSAFSRAMSIHEREKTHVLVSGTAAIDDRGFSLYEGDTRSQILKTAEIVNALIAEEGASMRDICTATIFLKKGEDLPIYRKVAAEAGLADLPAVYVIADVCRDELLFELDATVSMRNGAL